MKFLVVGSGGREYSIGLGLRRDPNVKKVYFSPGNGATAELGENIPADSFEALAGFCEREGVDITIVGPEQPLVAGIVDIFKERGLKIFGCSKAAAMLEGSKAHMKEFAKKYDIPTAKYIQSTNEKELTSFARGLSLPVVIKADGLCGGKGVIIAKSYEECDETINAMVWGESFGEAGERVVVEEYLDGFELSVFAISDGEHYITLPASQDHKRVGDDDSGPNTGGMGAYAPTPLATPELMEKIEQRIIAPAISGMQSEGTPFEGVLFCGIMVVDGEPKLLEFNVRFGDPECEVLLPLLKTPLSALFEATVDRKLKDFELALEDAYCVGVVAAAKNYPYGSSESAKIEQNFTGSDCCHISFAGVEQRKDGLYSKGGRIFVAVARDKELQKARDEAYKLLEHTGFAGMKYRKDIAKRAL